VRAAFDPVMKVLGQVRQELSNVKDVVSARPGWEEVSTENEVSASSNGDKHSRRNGSKLSQAAD
jgi:hypothetical protein